MANLNGTLNAKKGVFKPVLNADTTLQIKDITDVSKFEFNGNGQALVNVDLNGFDLTNTRVLRLQPQALAPATPQEGWLYYNDSTNQLNIYNGTSFEILTTSINASFSDAGFELYDDVTPTKKAKFQVSGITAATTRTFTFPDLDDTLVTLTATQTLTNKSIALGTNTLTGTTAQFNTALTDNDFATLAGIETLTNKTLTQPIFVDLGFVKDTNGNELLIFDSIASAVNEITLANAITATGPIISATGGDTDIDINLNPKGAGFIKSSTFNVVTGRDYISSYDTTTQTVAVANTFQDVVFSTNAQLNGWTHTAATANFTCARSGLYLVTYHANTSKTAGANSTTEIVALFNAVQVAGSATQVFNTVNNGPLNLQNSFIINATATQIFKLQMTGSTTSTNILPNNPNATVKPSITLTITRVT